MKKTAKRFFSALLVLAMVLSMVPMTVFATEHEEHAEVETVVDATVETAEETTETAAEEEKKEGTFNFASLAPALLNADETEVDESNPAIIALETELKEIKVLNADGESVALTEEEIQTILALYQQYMDHWAQNANILGVQTPFFLSYNDKEDDLGVLGEILVLGGNTVDEVRNGEMTYDEITGMIQTFIMADQFGVSLYGDAIKNARNEILDLIEESGAQTDVQKYLVINNWLAQNVVFDMEYIMNTDKEPGEEPMRAENPQEHEYYDVVYQEIYNQYEEQIRAEFENKIRTALEAEFKLQYYQGAIESIVTDMYTAGAISEAAKDEQVVAAVKEAYREEAYKAALEELKDSEVYEEAYNARFNEYLDDNCEHDFETVFTFVDAGNGAYTATADLTCTICDRFHDDVEATTENKEVEATCTEPKKTVCVATVTVGDYTATEEKVLSTVGEALGHNYGEDDKCTVCGEFNANHAHEYAEEVTTAATCEEAGVLTKTCKCGNVQTETIPATGHTEVVDAAVAATCTATGLTEGKHCSVCEKVLVEQTAVEATGHTDEDANYICDVCEETITAEETPDEGTGEGTEGGTTTEEAAPTLNATEEGTKIREEADAVAKLAGDEAVEAAANAAADEAVAALTEEEIQAMAEDAVKNNPDAMAAIDAEVATMVEDYMTTNADAIAADPVAFVDAEPMFQNEVPVTDADGNYILGEDGNPVMMTIAAQIHAGWDSFWADAQENGVEVDPVNAPGYKMTVDEIVAQQMDTPQEDPMLQKYDENGNPIEGEYMTPNEAIPVFADQAATQLTEAVLNYWQGSHFGALGRGSAVCLGYTKAFSYLVQCLRSDIYTGGADIDTASNWKTTEELYYTNGELDITKNYAVDSVRITFDADVTMYGETQENFNSDHFWNAVQVDGKWYYVDPCYTDVYTEVMIRDRVETDGSMNHLYFMFSHGTTTSLYDGYYSEIKTLYADAATYTDYEDSWISRIKSNIYADDGYFYYVYDSTDMVSLMDEFENSTAIEDIDISNNEMKLVRHKLDGSDAGTNGDTDYEELIVFNYLENEDDDESEARVNGEKNDMLTALYAQYEEDREKYPSLAITCALYNDKVYFNLSNCILYYDLSTKEVVLAKEYNTVYGLRDDTNPFGGMAFSTVSSASQADFTVENHPIAGISLKGDGNLYVSIATNFAFISGKDPHNSSDQGSYGYEFEESNFNASYNSYTNDQMNSSDYGDMGYESEDNDNDEFMWSANFVETLDMSDFGGTSHKYAAVEIEASCGHNAYTENRCTECGAIEAGSRVEVADTACEHHYIRFDETYYTKNDNGNWNSGFCYVCTECLFSIEEPTEPDPDEDYESAGTTYEEQLAIYEEEKAIYDNAVETAGHTYVVVDGTWSDDHNSVSFNKVECSAICTERPLDCLLEDDTITQTFNTSVTLSGATVIDYEGDCTTGVYATYQIVDETNGIEVTAQTTVQLDPGEHLYEYTFVWTEVTDENGNILADENGYDMYTVDATAVCKTCEDTRTVTGLEATIDTAACVEPTVEASGKTVYTVTATFTDEDGKTLGTATDIKEIRLVAAPVVSVSNKASTGKIVVSWGAVDGAEKYQVYRSTSKDGTYSRISTTTGTSVTNTKNAEVGTRYYYKVRAVALDSGEYSVFSDIKSRTVDLPQPDISVVSVKASGKIQISWDAIEGAKEYKLYRSLTGEDGTFTRISTTTGTKVTNTKNMEVGQTYYYKVYAVAENSEANSAYSAVESRAYRLARPEVTLTNVASSGKIKITWKAIDGAKEYKVYRSTTGEDGSFTRISTTTGTSVTNTKNTEAGVKYYYKVIAIAEKSAGNSFYSTVKSRVCDLARPSVSITRNSDGNPKLSWNKVEGAVEYKVYRSTTGEDGTFTRITTTTKTTVTNTKNVVAGQTYYYKVIAIAEPTSANSAYSKVISITAK